MKKKFIFIFIIRCLYSPKLTCLCYILVVKSQRDEEHLQIWRDKNDASSKEVRIEAFERINQCIDLPSLSETPKDWDRSGDTAFFMTEQRSQILKEWFENLKRNGNVGLVPSGPFGIGKSALGYALACIGFINKLVVIYIVSFVYFVLFKLWVHFFIFYLKTKQNKHGIPYAI